MFTKYREKKSELGPRWGQEVESKRWEGEEN